MAKLVGSGSITLYDMNDITPSPTKPTAPTADMIWMDTSAAPYQFYKYNATTGKWDQTGYKSLKELDPTRDQEVVDAYTGVRDLDDDGKLTRFERSLVRNELALMVGKFLAATDTMPTTAQIDVSGVGDIYALRKESRDLGLPTSDAAYTGIATKYEALRTYLSGLSVKAWNITDTTTITVVSATWDLRWNEYYIAFNNLKIANALRAQKKAEGESKEATTEAIKAVSNALEHASATLANPTIIDAPIATLALPQFEGRHVDSWEIDRNLVRDSSFTQGKTFWSIPAVYGRILPPEEDKPTAGIVQIDNTSSTSITSAFYNNKRAFLSPKIGDKLQISFEFWCEDFDTVGPKSTVFTIRRAPTPTGGTVTSIVNPKVTDFGFTESGKWVKGTYTFTFSSSNAVEAYYIFGIYIANPGTGSGIVRYKIRELKVALNPETDNYALAPEETFAQFGNRIKPVTTPLFNSGSSHSMLVKAYGDGVDNDIVEWDATGNATKIKKWEDKPIDGSVAWTFGQDLVGSTVVRAPSFSSSLPVPNTLQAVKYNSDMLSVVSTITAADQIMLDGTTGTLSISVADADTGWGETYTPTPEDIKAYFWGWKLTNGTFGATYTGTGDKIWHPIGDTDFERAVNEAPDRPSPSIESLVFNPYQAVYRLQDPFREVIQFNGVLSLVQGANSVTVAYPANTPSIVKGTIKYATNLATATRDITYLIPTVQERIKKAEEVITDDSIVSTVLNSVDYKIEMSSTAAKTDLANLVDKDELGEVSNSIGEAVGNALDLIKYDPKDPFVQQAEFERKADSITAKFSASGGMNLIKNSIGFAQTDFWTQYDAAAPVTTINTTELDTLGFGSGFAFAADGKIKGLTQTINVKAAQPYTLSWYLKKLTAGADSSFRFWIEIMEGGVVQLRLGDNSATSSPEYENQYLTYTPTGSEITIRVLGYGSVEAVLTGLMLTIGDVPLIWSLATGEVYNTNIRMDINGIRVSQFDAKRVEIGYTLITPKEFAGYAKVGTSFEKVFYLNGQQTVTKKLKALEEISMGTVKAIRINSGTNNGWGFVKNSAT